MAAGFFGGEAIFFEGLKQGVCRELKEFFEIVGPLLANLWEGPQRVLRLGAHVVELLWFTSPFWS